MALSEYETLTLVMTIVGILLIPAIGLLIRLVVKWTRTEARIEELSADMRELMTQAREDRNATNLRLRWLEERIWGRQQGGKHAIRDTPGG